MRNSDPYGISKLKEAQKLKAEKEHKLESLLVEMVYELKIIEDRLDHIEENSRH